MGRWAPEKSPNFLAIHFTNYKHMIRLQRPSSCASLLIDPDQGEVTVTFKDSGVTETFTDVNGGDIENLLSDSTVSVGKWVNQVLLGNAAKEEVVAA